MEQQELEQKLRVEFKRPNFAAFGKTTPDGARSCFGLFPTLVDNGDLNYLIKFKGKFSQKEKIELSKMGLKEDRLRKGVLPCTGDSYYIGPEEWGKWVSQCIPHKGILIFFSY